MGLLNGETWDDYVDKQVYVTTDFGTTGFLAHVVGHNPDGFVMIERDDNKEIHNIEEEYVYGTWVLEDW
jgi:hypothetical protein